ncbi:MBL fold metallo-hydrolase [Gynurincola endophyticus]|jgi:hydroxyacylglutathione hydrolase|uniref:MBL fold metallo-hydrolase n=1 Tax=Gynurincola endophyticus TaxID=2479004 RepID=UPI000F8E0698|nr:MBL fold metallo-hydrolase [Gynurincola endophyticus]
MLEVKKFTFNPIQENTYVVYEPQGVCCIIDPGCYFDHECNQLKDFINSNDLEPKYLLNTHCHLDHVFGNKFVADTFGLSLHLHPNEKIMLENAPVSGQKWGLPFENYEGPLEFIDEKDQIIIGNEALDILFLPGHAPGHLGFYSKTNGFIVSGDVLFERSIGRTDLPLGDYDTLINSIKTSMFELPDDTIVYPGHGNFTTIGVEKKQNPFLS